jgi:hypothetical protein
MNIIDEMDNLSRDEVQKALRQTLTPTAAAKKYAGRVTARTLYNWIDNDTLPTLEGPGGTVVIWEPDLERVLAEREGVDAFSYSPSASASPSPSPAPQKRMGRPLGSKKASGAEQDDQGREFIVIEDE